MKFIFIILRKMREEMQNKNEQLINIKLKLEEISMDVESFKSMFLALEEALYYSKNWDIEAYRYMVYHMCIFINEITKDVEKVFKSINEEKSQDNIECDQAKH